MVLSSLLSNILLPLQLWHQPSTYIDTSINPPVYMLVTIIFSSFCCFDYGGHHLRYILQLMLSCPVLAGFGHRFPIQMNYSFQLFSHQLVVHEHLPLICANLTHDIISCVSPAPMEQDSCKTLATTSFCFHYHFLELNSPVLLEIEDDLHSRLDTSTYRVIVVI